jgi:hypothetical protein
MQVVRIVVLPAALVTVATLISCGSSTGEDKAIPTYTMGERAQAGPVIYTVFESKWAPQLGAGSTARIPKNRFCLLRLSMVNSGSNDAVAPTMNLIDDNGQRYPELSDGEEVPQWAGFVRRIKPADTLTGNVIFDVPARHYKLEVTDEMEERKAIIDIPLSFTSDQLPINPTVQDSMPQQAPLTPK